MANLLLVAHCEELARSGAPAAVAVVRGAEERLLPILMTATSSALALLPLVWAGDRIGSELQHPIAVVMLGGLVSSTLLNLFVIPAAYSLWGGTPESRPLAAERA